MEKTLHRAKDRGKGEHGWLSTRYSFSFADWHNPERMGFGKLRVLNDDTIAPASGFGMHPHRDMEIITIVTAGTLTHKDNMGNTGTIEAGDVQAMSAGTGIVHAEWNNSADAPLSLFQLWIEPNRKGVLPRYGQKPFPYDPTTPGIMVLAAPDGNPEGLPIHQDAYISRLVLDGELPYVYKLRSTDSGLYVFVIETAVTVAGERLERRDALGVWGTSEVRLAAPGLATVLLIEVPMR